MEDVSIFNKHMQIKMPLKTAQKHNNEELITIQVQVISRDQKPCLYISQISNAVIHVKEKLLLLQ